MRNGLFLAATASLVTLGGCLFSYSSGDYDKDIGWGGGGGDASTSSSGMGAMTGSGGAGGPDACHPAFCDADASTTTCTPNLACPSVAWSARWGALGQQRVFAVASDGARVALAGEYDGQSFEIGEKSPRTLPLASPNFGPEAFVTLLDDKGSATWASPVALGIGYQPRSAYAVAFAGKDIVVAGSRASTEGGTPNVDVFIRKFTPGDNNAVTDVGPPLQFGGDGPDKAVAVAAAATGEFYVAGTISAPGSKAVSCNMAEYPLKNGMFVVGYDSAGTCKWFAQAEGEVEPTALVYDGKNLVSVVGHFKGTLKLPSGNLFTTKTNATDSFVLGLEPSSGVVGSSTQIQADVGGAVRALAATTSIDGKVYIAGQLKGKTSVEPDRMTDEETAVFVMPVVLENPWKQVFPGGNVPGLEAAAGTSITFAADGSLYVGGTFRDVIDIDPTSPSGTFERAGVNPFLARIDPVAGALSWFDVYNGRGQQQFTTSFFVTTLQSDVLLAGKWITDFSFTKDGSKPLTAKGDGMTDDDIIAAKVTPNP
ncbi:hypothetical protein [Polyangium mundeleinium]|uniref:Cell surface protein n=1 Tax=Polyangium mundeleinium TaxID=2995306 RepID=A0ABT5EU82_9BACT|nr:hypothetical protein [Polyangium mundeleinium]MDC0745378.1 hypothetical protein [Polyangium mundeleinium]